MKALGLFITITVLSGCSVLQSSYDHAAIDQCRELPNSDERLACERSARDAARDRRAERLRDN